ncbi:hypothetical protein PHJA_000185200 [Phtheirospermum japonicum]|uniref:Replication protein A 70 kDa DNA-binding subunit B/D first OB fold domain-containing protein n=1 Tax=Phtheirospermum japonicum TaxID=374723 RepID=A0A830B5Y7_9LAMI|nr:hypothetical protein PHJA_000185200 [Phtheirospermum japonicum]
MEKETVRYNSQTLNAVVVCDPRPVDCNSLCGSLNGTSFHLDNRHVVANSSFHFTGSQGMNACQYQNERSLSSLNGRTHENAIRLVDVPNLVGASSLPHDGLNCFSLNILTPSRSPLYKSVSIAFRKEAILKSRETHSEKSYMLGLIAMAAMEPQNMPVIDQPNVQLIGVSNIFNKAVRELFPTDSRVSGIHLQVTMAMRYLPVNQVLDGVRGWTVLVQMVERRHVQLSRNVRPVNYRRFLFTDSEGTKVSAVIYRNDVRYFTAMLMPFKRYYISSGTLRKVDPRYKVSDYEYSWVIHNRTLVEEHVEQVPPTLPCHFELQEFQKLFRFADTENLQS